MRRATPERRNGLDGAQLDGTQQGGSGARGLAARSPRRRVSPRPDEAFSRPESGIAGTPISQRGNCEKPEPYRSGGTLNDGDFRDIAHTEPRVRAAAGALGYGHFRATRPCGWHTARLPFPVPAVLGLERIRVPVESLCSGP